MERTQRPFVWVLPLLWGACSLAQWGSPGDEYGFYALSALPAMWLAPLLFLGRVSQGAIPIFVLLAGVPVMLTCTARGVRWSAAVWKEARQETGGQHFRRGRL